MTDRERELQAQIDALVAQLAQQHKLLMIERADRTSYRDLCNSQLGQLTELKRERDELVREVEERLPWPDGAENASFSDEQGKPVAVCTRAQVFQDMWNEIEAEKRKQQP